MNSAGEMFLTSGDVWYADRLEQIAFNALPVRPDAPIHSGCEIPSFRSNARPEPHVDAELREIVQERSAKAEWVLGRRRLS